MVCTQVLPHKNSQCRNKRTPALGAGNYSWKTQYKHNSTYKQCRVMKPLFICLFLNILFFLAVLEYSGFHQHRYNSFLNLSSVFFHCKLAFLREDKEDKMSSAVHTSACGSCSHPHGQECTESRATPLTFCYI